MVLLLVFKVFERFKFRLREAVRPLNGQVFSSWFYSAMIAWMCSIK
jgi:hypothetical protein